MRRLVRGRALWRGDRGSASLEFLVGALVLLVPIVYLTVALGVVQQATFGAESVARHIAQRIARAGDAAEVDAAAAWIVRDAEGTYGMRRGSVEVRLECPEVAVCPSAGAIVIVQVRARVALPFAPAVLGLEHLSVAEVTAMGLAKAPRAWGSS